MNSYIDVGIARPPGVKAQDTATLVRMSLYTVNVMRIYIDICMNKPKNIDDNLCRSVL